MTRVTRDHWLLTLVFLCAGVLLYQSFGYTEMAGSDMWWHIAAGREILQTQTLWMVDDWSYTAHGNDWLNHEWLAGIMYYLWVSLWGVQAIVYWKWLILGLTFLTLQYTLGRDSGSALAGFLCAAIAAAIAAPFLDVRPHIYTLLFYALLLLIAHRRRPRLYLLLPLFIVWVNLHGGFFFGLMALAILLFPWRNFTLPSLRSAVFIGLLCLLAALLNPSGLGTFFYPLKYAFDETSPFKQLAEWLPPFSPGGIQSPLFFVFMWAPIGALVYFLPAVRRRLDVPWEGLALMLLTLAMAVTSRRFIPIYAMSMALAMAPLLGLMIETLLAGGRGRLVKPLLACGALLFGLYRLQPYPLQSGPAFHYLTAEYSYPVDLMNMVEANGLHGKVFAYYNWGGYLHWRTDGDMKVYIDGRADTIYDADTYNNYVTVLGSKPGWMEIIEADQPDYILWPQTRGSGLAKQKALLESGRWRPVYQDSEGWLLARDDLELPDTFKRPPQTAWLDVTGMQLNAWRGNRREAIAHGEKARAAMPWHRSVCHTLPQGYRLSGDVGRANDILLRCWEYFPSRLFRAGQG
ncbi:MAG: hypothetical protein AAGA91_01425 [Pseudomonadota bacterium]